MSTPPQANKDNNSQSNRTRAATNTASTSPNLLHRTLTGRIGRPRSASSQLSTRNRRTAIWETTRDHIWQSNCAERHLESQRSLPEYIAPLSLAVSPSLPAASTESNISSLEAIPAFEETTGLVGESSRLADIGRNQEGFSSMSMFMMPPQSYPHEPQFGHYSSNYPSPSYAHQYSGAESETVMASTASPQPVNYATSYAASPAMVGSPNMSQRGGSVERESVTGAYTHQYSSAHRSPYQTGTSSPQPVYPYTSAPAPYVPSYTAHPGYAPPQTAYGTYQYTGYDQPQTSTGYIPPVYPPYSNSEDPAVVRMVNDRPKAQCFDHGCNGRQFSTFSNLLRHQREKSGKAQKSTCDRCGAEFTRTTARNGHMAHDKCKRKGSGSSPPLQ